ncbi:MAG: rhodanese-like domain-containing protein [Flavobacteriales bacterium]
MKRFFQLLAFLQVSLLGCAQNQSFEEKLESMYKGTVELVNPKDLPTDAVLLDTREKEEFDVSHIPNALFTGYKDFNTDALKDIPKTDTIVVYCSVGYRSERIGEKLQKMGYSNVFNLYGGIFEWKNLGNSVINAEGSETEKVHTYNKTWSKWLTRGEKVY